MKRWARLDGNRNVITAFDGADDKNVYADIAHLLIEVAADVRDNDLVDEMGNKVPRPVVVPPLGALEFRDRFTADEKTAIYTAAGAASAVGRQLRIWLDDTSAAQEVHLDHPRIIAGLDWLVANGILTAQRKTEILS